MSSPAPQLRPHRRRSLAGPIVLIAIGVIFLLGNMHVLSWIALHHYFARYWPALLILWGAIRLLEHWQDNRMGVPSRGMTAGGILLIIFIVLIGLGFTGSEHVNWHALGDDNDFGGFFGNSYTFDSTVEQPFAAGTDLRIVSDRGDVAVNSWNEAKIKVVAHKRVVADNEEESKKIDSQTQPTFTSGGKQMTVSANTGGAGNSRVASDLEVYIPATANLDVSTRRGDIRIAGRDGSVTTSSHGDVSIADNHGPVTISLRRGDVRVTSVKGDVSLDGRADNVSISDVTGQVRLSGEFFGDLALAKIAKGVVFHSSRTDMTLARLDGNLSMDAGDLRASAVAGPTRLITRSKDIHLEDMSGDAKIVNQNGILEYRARSLGEIDLENERGNLQVSLPERAAFQVEAVAHRGEIQSDFSEIRVQSERSHEQRAAGSVGNGGPHVKLVNNRGDVEIRKWNSAAAPSAPPPPPVPPGKKRSSVLQRGYVVDYPRPASPEAHDYGPGVL